MKIWLHANPVDDAADAAGTRLPGSGYVAAPDGAFTLNQIAAINMSTGTVTMDRQGPEDYDNQRFYEYIVIRRRSLWWNDVNFLAECVKFAGSRPWVWSDKIWHCPLSEFAANMPKYVLQSN